VVKGRASGSPQSCFGLEGGNKEEGELGRKIEEELEIPGSDWHFLQVYLTFS